jgi:hypothetical protein
MGHDGFQIRKLWHPAQLLARQRGVGHQAGGVAITPGALRTAMGWAVTRWAASITSCTENLRRCPRCLSTKLSVFLSRFGQYFSSTPMLTRWVEPDLFDLVLVACRH